MAGADVGHAAGIAAFGHTQCSAAHEFGNLYLLLVGQIRRLAFHVPGGDRLVDLLGAQVLQDRERRCLLDPAVADRAGV